MQPDTWISATAGFLGGILGGSCTILATRYQFNLQAKEQQRQHNAEITRQINGFKLEIGAIKQSNAAAFANGADIAKRMRVFFHEHPDQLGNRRNREFYDEYLAKAVDPSPNYFGDDEVLWMGFLTDAAALTAVSG